MSLLWAKVASRFAEEHDEHAMHPYFRAAGIKESPCGYRLCSDHDEDHGDAFDEAEARQWNGGGTPHDLDLRQPVHGFESGLSEETANILPAQRPAKQPPVVFRHKGQVHIMDGHNRLADALLRGQSHYPVVMHDLDKD